MGKHSLEKHRNKDVEKKVNDLYENSFDSNSYLNEKNDSSDKNNRKREKYNKNDNDYIDKNSYSKNNRKINYKKIFMFIFLLLIIMALIGGSIYYANNKNKNVDEDEAQIKSIEKQTNSIFKSLKNGKKDEINKYIDYDQLLGVFDESFTELSDDDKIKISKALFDKMDWKVKNANISGEKASVRVQVENKNFINVVTDLMKKLVAEKKSENEINDEVSINKLVETLNETTEMETNIGNITFVKNEDSWKLVLNDEFRDLIFPEAANISSVITGENN